MDVSETCPCAYFRARIGTVRLCLWVCVDGHELDKIEREREREREREELER